MTLALLASAFLIGFAGSGHCAAMCGPIVTLMESGIGTHGTPLWRRVAYQSGRLAWYVIAGTGVAMLTSSAVDTAWGSHIALVLRVLSVIVVVVMAIGLFRAGRSIGPLEQWGHALWRRATPLARFVLPMNSRPKAFFAGMLWGAIPCGMLYGMIALAAANASPTTAIAMMVGFWLGTLPSLLALSAGLRVLQPLRHKPIAGCVLIIVAAFSVYSMVPHDDAHEHAQHGQMSSVHVLR